MSSPEVVACPKLEGLVLEFYFSRAEVDIKSLIGMAAARASRGAKLRSIRVVDGRDEPRLDPAGALELRKHAWHVEYGAGLVHSSDEDD